MLIYKLVRHFFSLVHFPIKNTPADYSIVLKCDKRQTFVSLVMIIFAIYLISE